METRAYRVVTTDDGRYQIERSVDGGSWKELYAQYRGDFRTVWLFSAKLFIAYFMYRDRQMINHKAKAGEVVYGPKPASKRKKGSVQ